jgi:hypothetical protein
MIWWFLILAFSSGAVLWVGISFYLHVRRQMKHDDPSREAAGDAGKTTGPENS